MSRLITFIALLVTNIFAYAATSPVVDVVYPEISQSNKVLSLSGTVEAKQHARLAPLQSGVVASLLVDAGDVVSKGQKLIVLDDKFARINVEQARADYQAAQAIMNEAQRLLDEVVELSSKNVIEKTLIGERQSNLAIAKAQYSGAKAELAHRQEELARHSLFAPFNGVIASRNIDLGEWVTQQTSVFTLVGDQQLRVNVAVPQEYYAVISAATSQSKDINVSVVPDFSHMKPIQAKVSRVVAVADSTSRALTAWVDIAANEGLVVGMSTQVLLTLPSSSTDVVWLPKSAIKYHPDGGRSIFVVENGVAKNMVISVVEEQNGKVAVSDLTTKNPVIVSGVPVLTVGSKVTIKQGNNS
ncbi:efflux RND transporter periplasmic adaptor subunit [Thalassomonas sp. M1454]|uniref:efflux RND transporter periplasmic adaptor subunit n=1 Tax=Thalassomonas sp. M1454 TaxID=2594477 RepID=UPI00117D9F55|nr:efflux RND transporter periplasmic adaptor subunit [Thalassomonas sp. M1454]TRX54508.1 efflux RND transporter periplasmic adaptor subunit [Thalassomonas sp. M1454]